MSEILLTCWIFSQDVNDLFSVKLSAEDTVLVLRQSIKANFKAFANIEAWDLVLRKVSVSRTDYVSQLTNLKKDDGVKLNLLDRLSSVFSRDNKDFEVVVVFHSPPLRPVPRHLNINYWVYGDSCSSYLSLNILDTELVSELRFRIEAQALRTQGQAMHLKLWKVSLLLSEPWTKDYKPIGPELPPYKNLGSVFPGIPQEDYLHIVAYMPPLSSVRAPVPPTPFKQIADISMVRELRQCFCHNCEAKAPSTGANPQTFQSIQEDPETRIPCNRPNDDLKAIPITLLHPLFGNFVDDCSTSSMPTGDNMRFASALVNVLSKVYETEEEKRNQLLLMFHKFGLHIKCSKIKSHITDGDLSVGPFDYMLAAFKNEVGSEGADPYLQGTLFYLEATRDRAPRFPNTVLPCLIVMIFGPYIAFAGAVWTDRPYVEMLSAALPSHFHPTNTNMMQTLARHLCAFQRILGSLEAYYEGLEPNSSIPGSMPLRNPTVPYPTMFASVSSQQPQVFKYLSRLEGNDLIFKGKLHSAGDDTIFIKFAQQYSQEVHQFCASRNFAPQLLAVETIPGGWLMVVMEDISQDYVDLHDFLDDYEARQNPDVGRLDTLLDNLHARIVDLHDGGFVHGDIRDANIMVKKSGLDSDGSFILLDFDWSGRIGKARYPFFVNSTTVRRPEGVLDGELIEPRHDLEMLDFLRFR